MNKLDKQYQDLLQDILENGHTKKDRTGTGTISVFGKQIRHNMKDGFPLLTTKKMSWKTLVTELLWFLNGQTNIKYLIDNGCHIWDGDAYKNFVNTVENNRPEGYTRPVLTQEEFIDEFKHNKEFADKWGELGPIYGKQWRDWNYQNKKNHYVSPGQTTHHDKHIDQIKNSIELLKKDPDSRRNRVSAWNVGELDQMVLPPCHTDFQFYTRVLDGSERWKLLSKKVGEKAFRSMVDDIMPFGGGLSAELEEHKIPIRAVSLMWSQRSVDTFLGLPFNIASYGLLLEIIAREVNMMPEHLIGNLGDTHLYLNHIDQAKEQISRKPYNLPDLKIMGNIEMNLGKIPFDDVLRDMTPYDFVVDNYKHHPAIKAPLSN